MDIICLILLKKSKRYLMIKSSLVASFLALTFLFSGCSDDKASQDANSMIVKNEYILTDLANKQLKVIKQPQGFTLEGAENKVIIFDIFATWCPPCQDSASHLSSLQEKYKDELVVIGVTIEDNIANAKLQEFAEKYNAKYTLVNSNQNRRMVDAVAKNLDVGERFPIPMMAMYKNGVLVNYYLGAIQEEFIESDIKKSLGK